MIKKKKWKRKSERKRVDRNPGKMLMCIVMPDYKNNLYLVPYFYTIKYDIFLFK